MGNGVAQASVRGWSFLQHGGEAVLKQPRETKLEENTMNKVRFVVATSLVAFALAAVVPASAANLIEPGYGTSVYLTHSVSSESITSFDWSLSGATTYYQTSTSSYNFGGLFTWINDVQSTAVAGNADYSGASVVRIDDNIYYNTSSTGYKIWKHDPSIGATGATQVSMAPNWGLFRRKAGEMFITGTPNFSSPNEVFRAALTTAGNFESPPVSLGTTIGSSGPLAFDTLGNMFYAPGYGDKSIYRYTAADVNNSVADPTNTPLPSPAERLWWDYSSSFSNSSGATGLAVDDIGNLYITLTDFSSPSFLVKASANGTSGFANYHTILSSTRGLGDVRLRDGSIYLAEGNEILQVVPEPQTVSLVLLGGAALLWFRHRRHGSF
jgi:hypothetical protein